jgi:hypothetical protein
MGLLSPAPRATPPPAARKQVSHTHAPHARGGRPSADMILAQDDDGTVSLSSSDTPTAHRGTSVSPIEIEKIQAGQQQPGTCAGPVVDGLVGRSLTIVVTPAELTGNIAARVHLDNVSDFAHLTTLLKARFGLAPSLPLVVMYEEPDFQEVSTGANSCKASTHCNWRPVIMCHVRSSSRPRTWLPCRTSASSNSSVTPTPPRPPPLL